MAGLSRADMQACIQRSASKADKDKKREKGSAFFGLSMQERADMIAQDRENFLASGGQVASSTEPCSKGLPIGILEEFSIWHTP